MSARSRNTHITWVDSSIISILYSYIHTHTFPEIQFLCADTCRPGHHSTWDTTRQSTLILVPVYHSIILNNSLLEKDPFNEPVVKPCLFWSVWNDAAWINGSVVASWSRGPGFDGIFFSGEYVRAGYSMFMYFSPCIFLCSLRRRSLKV